MSSKIKKYFIVGLVTIVIPNIVGAMAMFNEKQEGPGFYKLGRDELKETVESLGYSKKFSWFVNRDSKGSMLRLFNWDSKTALVMSCEGKVKEIPLKGERSWLNDDLEIVAWFKNERIYFDSKAIASSENYVYKQALSGNYFFRSLKWGYRQPSDFNIEIFSIHNPVQPLIEVEILSSTARLFVKDNKIYLTGQLPANRNVIKFYIFEIKPQGLIKINELTLKREREASSPFYVVDINLWNDEAIIADTRDFPSKSRLFVFNLLTQEKKSFGYGSEGFYMQCNILNAVLINK